MMLGKRKLQNKTASQKYDALENCLSYETGAVNHGVPKSTLSNSVKNKQKNFSKFGQSISNC